MRSTREIAVVSAITAACLLPFVGKAFSLDDPLFLWAAEQIRRHPLDPYGFAVNWYGTWQSMWSACHNPPATSYYMAAIASLFGTSEVAMHLAFLVPAIGAAVATWKLAAMVTSKPIVAAVTGVATPAFLASSTGLMCDTMMTCFFTWAVVLWVEGLCLSSWRRLLAAALFVVLAVLTKYFALCLFPLLVAATFVAGQAQVIRLGGSLALPKTGALSGPLTPSPSPARGEGRSGARKLPTRAQYVGLVWLGLSALVIVAFEWWTWRVSGTVHVLHASRVAAEIDQGMPLWAKTAVGLSFAGGSFLPIVFFAPAIFSKRVVVSAVLVAAAVAIYSKEIAWRAELAAISYHRLATWPMATQLGLFIGAGGLVLWLALVGVRESRREPLLLVFALWILGTFVFASYLNWGNNVRSVLPMAPAVGVLIARRLEAARVRRAWPLTALALVVSLAVAWGDYAWANSWRVLADDVADAAGAKPLWFEGHWGFQWYLEKRGGRAVDFVDPRFEAGELVAVPEENTATRVTPEDGVAPSPIEVEAPTNALVIVMSSQAGAGFGSAFLGPLPFVFGRPEPQRSLIFTAVKPGRDWRSDASSDVQPLKPSREGVRE